MRGLMHAATSGASTIVKDLIESGANINEKDNVSQFFTLLSQINVAVCLVLYSINI
jgi:ankyrin repeat protein